MKKRFVLLFLCTLFLTPAQAQKKYALLIGVDYEGRLALDYTRQDAIKLGQILESNFGYTTKVLTRKSETTKTAINIAFSDLKNLDASYDQVIVFFSGHGVRDENSNEVGYLLPNDVDVNELFLTAIDMSIIQNLSRTLKARQAMFILDCCYSGIIGSYASMDVSGGDKTLRSRQILTAGRSGQKARMYEAKELSLYTFYLTRALSGGGSFLRADSDKDGELTAWDLQTDVEKKVSDHTRKKQTPRLYNFTEDDGIFLFRATNYERPAIPIVDNREKTKDDLPASPVRDVPPKDMVLIPAGTFRMGGDSYEDEKPVHGVKIDAFYMDKYEISVAEYAKFVNERNHKKPRYWDEQLQKLNRPVVEVSWSDAQAYATWARKRLPTEAEWEYAARGGLEQKKYPWGNESPDGKSNFDKDRSRDYSWENANKYLKDVNSYEPNGYSLYNMSGNVWEWCSDWYSDDYYKQFANSIADNPKGPEKGDYRVVRGGSWFVAEDVLRVAGRGGFDPGYGGGVLGFRCVQDR